MESKFDIIQYTKEDVEAIRKEFNVDTEKKREAAFKVIEEWLLKQDHLTKKKFDRAYIERCIITSKGSIEKAKIQIDKICTLRTLVPKYFQISNFKESELVETVSKCYFGYLPKLTKDRYRVLMLRLKHNLDSGTTNFERLHKYFAFAAAFLANFEYCRGFILCIDCLDGNIGDIIAKVNFSELQQFLPILTEGYGCKIKGIIFLTSSKVVEGFVKILKPFFKEKIRNRIHVTTSKERLADVFGDDMKKLPEEYGGNEKPLAQLHDNVIAALSTEQVTNVVKEMNSARTDETRRRIDKFNDQYMGMPGTFRTMSLD